MAVALFSSRDLTRQKFIVIIPSQCLQRTVNDRERYTPIYRVPVIWMPLAPVYF
jgi:hypothetical protein